MDSAVTALTAAGILVVASAGNEGTSNDAQPHYPSAYAAKNQGVISVAASDVHGNLWAQSNYGPKEVTLAAPGVQALGLGLGGLLVKDSGTSMAGRWHPGGCYHISYTSDKHFIAFAAPQVASAAAVLIAYAKSKGVQVDANPALPAALKKALGGSAKPFESSADASKVPAGVLDVQAAVVALDVQGLLNAQRQAAAATASVGVTIVLAVVFFLAGVLVTALAVFARMRFRNPPSPAVASEVDAP